VATETMGALLTALVAGGLVKLVLPPPRRLRSRVQPYLAPSATTMGRSSESGVLSAVFGPILSDLADLLAGVIDQTSDEITILKLRQAGWFRGLSEREMTNAYRMRQLKSVLVSTVLALVVGQVIAASFGIRLLLLVLGLLIGSTRAKGQLDKSIEARRELLKIEIYTVNQLLALRVRAGAGVFQAVRSTVLRGRGEVVSELDEALRLHSAGWAGPDAFRRIAELTPEPFCSRTYRLLATADERGADLASALLALSEDVRETRRESIKRTATKRRAAMLVPTIAILAPVLILFVAAPLPYLITAWR